MKKIIPILIGILTTSPSFGFLDGHPESKYSENSRIRPKESGIERLKRIRNTLKNLKDTGRTQEMSPSHSQSNPMPTSKIDHAEQSTNPNSTLPISPSPFVVSQTQDSGPGTNLFENPDPQEVNTPRIVALLQKCQKLGNYMKEGSADQPRAIELYKTHCFAVVDQIAIPQGLDLLYPVQASYLEWIGNFREANRYLTLLYQMNPRDLDTNLAFIRNLKELGEIAMATDLLKFYQESPDAKSLEDADRRLLQEIGAELSTPDTP